MIAGLALALTRVVQVRGVQRTLYGLCSAAMLLAIALTNSRGGLLALLAMVIGAVVTFSRNKPRAMAAALAVAGLLLVVAPGRMKNFDSKEESANSRFLFWKEGIIQLRAHPITGVGYLRFPDVNSGFVAHNSFVHCFAELGLPGFFFFMGTIFYAFKRPDSMASPRLRGKAAGIRAGKDGYEVIRESGAISQPPVPRDLIGARLAIMGYLAACFWITRTYTPVLYVFLSLPVAQQVAASGTAALNYGKLGDRMRNLGIIGGLCLALFVVVCLLVWKNS